MPGGLCEILGATAFEWRSYWTTCSRERAQFLIYCDNRGLVTIAIGFLVDKEHASDALGQHLARQLAHRSDVTFTKTAGAVASPDEVERDWQRVKKYGRSQRGAPAPLFAAVAQLRIDRRSIQAITLTIVAQFLDQLYAKRPFLLHYDERVAMALVDVRYNPAGVSLYGSDLGPRELWEAMDPRNPVFDLARAMTLFEQIWAMRATARYGLRHYQRVKWMRAGLLAMGGTEATQSL